MVSFYFLTLTNSGKVLAWEGAKTCRIIKNAYSIRSSTVHGDLVSNRLKDLQKQKDICMELDKLLRIGFAAKHNWMLELIVAYVMREWNHCYSFRGISKAIERLGLSYTKLTYTLAAADSEKQRQLAEATFPDLKKVNKR